jgi:hypothetical protein
MLAQLGTSFANAQVMLLGGEEIKQNVLPMFPSNGEE